MKNLIFLTGIMLSFFLGSFNNIVSAADQKEIKIPKILDRPLIPTGYGLTSLLNEDYYLGVFSIDRAAIYRSAEDLIFIDAPRRMEFKFLTDRKISGRTFGRQLAEGMKINNDKKALNAHIKEIKRFTGFFKKSLKKGDVVRIDYHKSFGTRVYLNNRRLGSISGEIADTREFYGFILRAWLGERPPSSKFKNGILGQNGDEYAILLQQRYNSSD